MSSNKPFDSRENLIKEIEKAGQYIIDHADNLLGEYPSLMSSFELEIKFMVGCATVIKVDRSHIVVDKDAYIANKYEFEKRSANVT